MHTHTHSYSEEPLSPVVYRKSAQNSRYNKHDIRGPGIFNCGESMPDTLKSGIACKNSTINFGLVLVHGSC